MQVKELIKKLKKMPPGAEVKHVWDGASRTNINHVWLSKGGEVCTADYSEYLQRDKDRPVGAPSKDTQSYWQTPNAKQDTDNDTNKPSWHSGSADEHGNVACNKCGKRQSPDYTACVYCCPHDVLDFGEEWDQGWRLTVCCTNCDKNFDFTNQILIDDYKVVKR